MRIGKVSRVLGSSAIASLLAVGSALWLSRFIGLWGYAVALVLFPFLNFLGAMPVNALDFWLRRSTKDEIWLRSHEGKQWLQTKQGQVRVVAIIDGTVCRVIDGRDIDCNARGHRTGSFPFPLPAFV